MRKTVIFLTCLLLGAGHLTAYEARIKKSLFRAFKSDAEGEYRDALKAYDEALNKTKRLFPTNPKRALFYVRTILKFKTKVCLTTENFDSLLNTYDIIINIDPGHKLLRPFHLRKGNASAALKRYAEAESAYKAYRDSLDIGDNDPVVNEKLGDIYILQKKYDRAASAYRSAYDAKSHYRYRAKRGIALSLAARHHLAAKVLKRTISGKLSDMGTSFTSVERGSYFKYLEKDKKFRDYGKDDDDDDKPFFDKSSKITFSDPFANKKKPKNLVKTGFSEFDKKKIEWQKKKHRARLRFSTPTVPLSLCFYYLALSRRATGNSRRAIVLLDIGARFSKKSHVFTVETAYTKIKSKDHSSLETLYAALRVNRRSVVSSSAGVFKAHLYFSPREASDRFWFLTMTLLKKTRQLKKKEKKDLLIYITPGFRDRVFGYRYAVLTGFLFLEQNRPVESLRLVRRVLLHQLKRSTSLDDKAMPNHIVPYITAVYQATTKEASNPRWPEDIRDELRQWEKPLASFSPSDTAKRILALTLQFRLLLAQKKGELTQVRPLVNRLMVHAPQSPLPHLALETLRRQNSTSPAAAYRHHISSYPYKGPVKELKSERFMGKIRGKAKYYLKDHYRFDQDGFSLFERRASDSLSLQYIYRYTEKKAQQQIEEKQFSRGGKLEQVRRTRILPRKNKITLHTRIQDAEGRLIRRTTRQFDKEGNLHLLRLTPRPKATPLVFRYGYNDKGKLTTINNRTINRRWEFPSSSTAKYNVSLPQLPSRPIAELPQAVRSLLKTSSDQVNDRTRKRNSGWVKRQDIKSDGQLSAHHYLNSKGDIIKKTLFTYDENGRLHTTSFYNRDGHLYHRITRAYDSHGNPARVIKQDYTMRGDKRHKAHRLLIRYRIRYYPQEGETDG